MRWKTRFDFFFFLHFLRSIGNLISDTRPFHWSSLVSCAKMNCCSMSIAFTLVPFHDVVDQFLVFSISVHLSLVRVRIDEFVLPQLEPPTLELDKSNSIDSRNESTCASGSDARQMFHHLVFFFLSCRFRSSNFDYRFASHLQWNTFKAIITDKIICKILQSADTSGNLKTIWFH